MTRRRDAVPVLQGDGGRGTHPGPVRNGHLAVHRDVDLTRGHDGLRPERPRASIKVRAALAGGLVFGLAAGLTVASWTDAERVGATFTASTFNLQTSVKVPRTRRRGLDRHGDGDSRRDLSGKRRHAVRLAQGEDGCRLGRGTVSLSAAANGGGGLTPVLRSRIVVIPPPPVRVGRVHGGCDLRRRRTTATRWSARPCRRARRSPSPRTAAPRCITASSEHRDGDRAGDLPGHHGHGDLDRDRTELVGETDDRRQRAPPHPRRGDRRRPAVGRVDRRRHLHPGRHRRRVLPRHPHHVQDRVDGADDPDRIAGRRPRDPGLRGRGRRHRHGGPAGAASDHPPGHSVAGSGDTRTITLRGDANPTDYVAPYLVSTVREGLDLGARLGERGRLVLESAGPRGR